MPKKLPPITELTACPHCAGDEFFVVQRYKGTGPYNRRFDRKEGADNTSMYDSLSETVGKTAFCVDCIQPVARWDQELNNSQYNEHNPDHYRS